MMRTLAVLILLSSCCPDAKKVYVYPKHCPASSKISIEDCVYMLGGNPSGASSYNYITIGECEKLKGK